MVDNHPRPADPERSTKPSSHAGASKRGLGRGLGALIPGAESATTPGVVELPIDMIRPNSLQPRSDFDREPLAELEASIREHGVLQPILVRPSEGGAGGYELVAGERRWRAASTAGLRSVPAIIRHLDDRGALEAALVENLQREDLNPLERARAYRRLLDDFGLIQEAVARRVGRSQPSVANTLRLLGLPPEVQTSLQAGRISEGHARALLAVDDPKTLLTIWRRIESRGLSVRATEGECRRAGISRGIHKKQRGTRVESNIIEQMISDRLGSPVSLAVQGKGSGEIRIKFVSLEDLDRLIELLAGRPAGIR